MHPLVSRLLIVFSIFCLSACQTAQNRYASLERERDSLLHVTAAQDSAKLMVDDFLETIALTLDSIRIAENMITMPNRERGKSLSTSQIRQNLKDLNDIIHRQRERIAELEERLASMKSADSTNYYRSLISHLYSQLDEKDSEIARVQNELNRQIQVNRQLTIRVDSLKNDNLALTAKTIEQDETIAFQKNILNAQDIQMNTCYIKIGTRKELQSAGLLERGVFKGNSLNFNQLNSVGFETADMRVIHEINLPSARAKILTSHPDNSYSIIKVSVDNTLLSIDDPGSFWSLSNYLIIQL